MFMESPKLATRPKLYAILWRIAEMEYPVTLELVGGQIYERVPIWVSDKINTVISLDAKFERMIALQDIKNVTIGD